MDSAVTNPENAQEILDLRKRLFVDEITAIKDLSNDEILLSIQSIEDEIAQLSSLIGDLKTKRAARLSLSELTEREKSKRNTEARDREYMALHGRMPSAKEIEARSADELKKFDAALNYLASIAKLGGKKLTADGLYEHLGKKFTWATKSDFERWLNNYKG